MEQGSDWSKIDSQVDIWQGHCRQMARCIDLYIIYLISLTCRLLLEAIALQYTNSEWVWCQTCRCQSLAVCVCLHTKSIGRFACCLSLTSDVPAIHQPLTSAHCHLVIHHKNTYTHRLTKALYQNTLTHNCIASTYIHCTAYMFSDKFEAI